MELVRRLAGPGAEAEVVADHAAEALTRFANSRIHQNVADATTTVRLRLHLDGRTAGGSTTVGRRGRAARPWSSGPSPRPGCARRTRLAGPDPAGAAAGPTAASTRRPPGPRRRSGPTGCATSSRPPAGWRRPVTAARSTRPGRSPTRAGQSAEGRSAEAAHGRHRPATRVRTGWPGWPSGRLADIDGAAWAPGRRPRRAPAGSRSSCRRAGTRWSSSRKPSPTCCTTWRRTGSTARQYAQRQSFAELGAQQFDPAVTIVDDAGDVGAAVRRRGHPAEHADAGRGRHHRSA